MYSVLVSKIGSGMSLVNDDVKKIMRPNSFALVLPWSMPFELDANKFFN